MIDLSSILDNKDLYVTRLPGGESFMWRLLSLREYNIFCVLRDSKEYNTLFLYSLVFDRCYVGNSNAINGNLHAGIFCSIGELIMWLSGDSHIGIEQEKQSIEQARMKYDAYSTKEVIKRTIMIAFPQYTPDIIQNWSWAKVMEIFTIAEAILSETKAEYKPIDTRRIMSKEDAAKQQKKANKAIDFKKENKELRDSIGDSVHPLDKPVGEMFNSDIAKRNAILAEKARRMQKAHPTERIT